MPCDVGADARKVCQLAQIRVLPKRFDRHGRRARRKIMMFGFGAFVLIGVGIMAALCGSGETLEHCACAGAGEPQKCVWRYPRFGGG